MAKTTIPGGYIEAGSIDTASLADTSITADKLHTTLDLTGKTITVATATAGDNDTTVASTAFVSTAIATKLPLAGGTMTGTIAGFTSTGIDDNADATAITIDSSENVGIGKTPSRSRKLEVAGDINLDNGYGLEWEDGGVGIVGSGATDTMTFATAGVERMRIDSAGTLYVSSSTSKIAEFERTGLQVFDLTISDAGDGDGQLWFNAQTNNTGFNFRPKSSGGTNTNALFIDPDGNVGIGTTSPAQSSSALRTLTVDGAIMTTNSNTSSIVYVYEQRFNGSNNLTLGYTTNGTTHTAAQIAAQNNLPLIFATNATERMKLDATGNLTQKHATDGSSRDRYTASAIPKISTVGLIGYWDPSKANAYSGSTMNDFSPSGSNDLTMGTGITFTSTADQSYWDFDGTTNANAYANIGLAAYRAASFSYWINWDNVNSLNSGYQLNGVQTGNHYMYIGVQQGANDAARLYGYIGYGIELPTNTATGNAYVNSNEWVYLTIQIGHGNSTLTNRTQGRAEVYLNGALVTRQNLTDLPTVAASNFYLGRVDGGYYLNGKMGPAVVYHRTLHQWEILENMKVHAPMYLT